MKNILSIVLLFIALAGNAQKLTHHLSLSVTNNGQLSQTMSRVYFYHYYAANTQKYRRIAFKSDLTYSITTANNLEFGIAAGYGQRTDHHSRNDGSDHISQHYASAMPFFAMKGWNFNALQLSAGAGIPCYLISDYTATVKAHGGVVSYMNIGGGTAFGISGLVRAKWNFTERLSLSGLMNFGVLYMDYAKDFQLSSYDASGNLTGTATSDPRQQKTIIPSPELSVAIGFRL